MKVRSPLPSKLPENYDISQGSAVVLKDVKKSFAINNGKEARIALKGISLDIPKGSIFGIIGRSGAGKSTLVRLINALEVPDSGEVTVDGINVTELNNNSLIQLRRKIGMVFQHFNLMYSKTVWQNIALPLEFAGVKESEIDVQVAELVTLVGLHEHAHSYPAQLSGGQKQRVGIARALALEPDVLLSDEATSALDPETTRSILALLRKINADRGVTIVLITHEMEVVQEIADYIAVVDYGAVVETGFTADVFQHPRHSVTKELLRSVRNNSLEDIKHQLRGVPLAPGWRRLIVRINDAKHLKLSDLLANAQLISTTISPIGGVPQGFVVFDSAEQLETLRKRLAVIGLTATDFNVDTLTPSKD